MPRKWTDPRDGTVWEVEAIARMQRIEPGQAVPMMDEVPWHVRFVGQSAVYDLDVRYEVGSQVREATHEQLQNLLDKAKARR
jgi:hypothetical protein